MQLASGATRLGGLRDRLGVRAFGGMFDLLCSSFPRPPAVLPAQIEKGLATA